MLLALLLSAYFLFTLWIWGYGSLRILKGLFFKRNQTFEPDFISIVCLGLVAQMFVVSIWVLFFPIGLYNSLIMLCLSLLGVGLLIKSIKPSLISYLVNIKKTSITQRLVFIIGFIAILIQAIKTPDLNDDGWYYRPAMKWAETYGTVVGLGNIQPWYALNSSWHILASAYSLSFINQQVIFYDLNFILGIIILIFIVNGLKNTPISRCKILQFSLAVLLYILISIGYFASPSADLPIFFFSWIIFTLSIKLIEEKTIFEINHIWIVIISLSAILPTIKPTASVMLLAPISLSILFLKDEKRKIFAFFIVTTIVLLLPWITRNLLLSGYPLYPVTAFSWLDLDWKMLPEVANMVQKDVYITSRSLDYNTENYDFGQWFLHWVEKTHFVLLFPILISPVIIFYKLITFLIPSYNIKNEMKTGSLVIACIALLGYIIWFIAAPNPRFALAYFYFIPFLYLADLVYKIKNKHNLNFMIQAVVILSMLVSCWNSIRKFEDRFTFSYLLRPGEIKKETVREFKVGEIKFYEPIAHLCWDNPLPCFKDYVGGAYQMRTKNLRDGFKPKRASSPITAPPI